MFRYISDMDREEIKIRHRLMAVFLNERQRRLLAGTDAKIHGRGGVLKIAKELGMSRNTVAKGLKEVLGVQSTSFEDEIDWIRKPGAGRKNTFKNDPTLFKDLNQLLDPPPSDDPKPQIQWTLKSFRELARELRQMGHKISHPRIPELLKTSGMQLIERQRMQVSRSSCFGDFKIVSNQIKEFQRANQPVISVKLITKERVSKDDSEEISRNDYVGFEDSERYSSRVKDMTLNGGLVEIDVHKETVRLAIETIFRWWRENGNLYRNSWQLMIIASCKGMEQIDESVWKKELGKLSKWIKLPILFSPIPQGTHRWNLIKHRSFSSLIIELSGKPTVSHEVIVEGGGPTENQSDTARVIEGFFDKKFRYELKPSVPTQ